MSFRYLCRCCLGLVFIVSAWLKFRSVDALSTYIYGLDLFSLPLSAIFARLLVAGEFIMGVFLLLRLWVKAVNVCALLSLSLFSVFLLVLLALGDDGNCFCFGEAIELSPGKSLLKNVLLFILLYYGSKVTELRLKYAWWFSALFIAATIALSFVIKKPYSLAANPEVTYHSEAFEQYMNQLEISGVRQNDSCSDWTKGKCMVAFVSTSCSNCQLLTRKLHTAFTHFPKTQHGFSPEKDVVWVVYDPKHKYDEVVQSGKFIVGNPYFIDSRIFSITNGILPLLLFVENGEVVDKMSNRTFSEERIMNFVDRKESSY